MTTDRPYVEVDVRALSVSGLDGGLGKLPTDAVIHLAEPTLNMKAGYWRARWLQGRPGSPGAARMLEFIGEQADAHTEGAREARVATSWTESYPTTLSGWRLSDLRALVEEYADLPDSTLVVISPAEHPADSRWSPVAYASTGRYAPNMGGGGNYGRFWSDEVADEEDGDRVPGGTVPAIELSPSI